MLSVLGEGVTDLLSWLPPEGHQDKDSKGGQKVLPLLSLTLLITFNANLLSWLQIDLDTIDVSNLNRQFLFRKEHVGKSKSRVARESALRFNPDAKIVAHHDSIMK